MTVVVDPAAYADRVTDAVAAQLDGFGEEQRARVYGAVYAAAATQALTDPLDFDVTALASVIRVGRGCCVECGRTFWEHNLDLAQSAWVICAPVVHTRRAKLSAWTLWVGIPVVSAGTLAWLPSMIATIRHRRRGWGPATALLLLFTLSFWTPADGVRDAALLTQFWLGSALYGGTQVKPWLSRESRRR